MDTGTMAVRPSSADVRGRRLLLGRSATLPIFWNSSRSVTCSPCFSLRRPSQPCGFPIRPWERFRHVILFSKGVLKGYLGGGEGGGGGLSHLKYKRNLHQILICWSHHIVCNDTGRAACYCVLLWKQEWGIITKGREKKKSLKIFLYIYKLNKVTETGKKPSWPSFILAAGME